METKKNFEKVNDVVRDFQKDGDTILALCTCGDEGCTAFCGDAYNVGLSFVNILERGFSSDADETSFKLATAVIFGIREFIKAGTPTSMKLLTVIGKMLDTICLDSMDTDAGEFNATDKDCIQCSQYAECLKKDLAKLGVEIEVKKVPKPKRVQEEHGS